jgi:3-oxoacyl-[acyl-carrier protein] reductase
MLKGKTALVTGASRGIGEAIALALGEAGATVIGTATTSAGADDISTFLTKKGILGKGVVLDVTEFATIPHVLQAIIEEWGAPLILVNNAAITKDNLFLRMGDEEWQAVMDTNLNSAFYVTKYCLKGMLKNRFGRIINVASIIGCTGNAGQSNYAAAKAGLMGFSKSLAQELAVRNITVNVVAPGFIATDMTKDLSPNIKEAIINKIPMKRMGTPEEVAAVVAFLASLKASYITGATFHVNGGMYMN